MIPEEPKRKFAGSQLSAGKAYRLIRAFTDYDGQLHEVGESWNFLSHNFVPYDDGLTLYAERDGKPISIRLQWREEAQGHIASYFSEYVEEL